MYNTRIKGKSKIPPIVKNAIPVKRVHQTFFILVKKAHQTIHISTAT